MAVLRYQDVNQASLIALLNKYHLTLKLTDAEKIPGSFWGESEAGLIKNTLYTRLDTPVHSIMHEACHYICMDESRRQQLDTNAEGDYDEENAVCYLQILLADFIAGFSQSQMCADMDEWGYTFRLGSAQAWFNNDADDAFEWLQKRHLITEDGRVSWRLNY